MKWLAFAVALFAACGDDGTPVAGNPPPPVLSVEEPPETAGFIGVIAAAETVDIAPAMPGVVTAVNVRPGDHVEAGQVVVEMDPAPARDQVRVAEAALSAAEAGLRQARAEVAEARRRHASEEVAAREGVSAQQNVAEAAHAVARAEAAARRAASNVAEEVARTDVARGHAAETKLRAPFGGSVALRFHDAGATVARGERIVHIIGDRGVVLRFAVPADRVRALGPGTEVTATVDTLATPVAATIHQVSPAVDPASGLVIVEATLGPDQTLEIAVRPGLAAVVNALPQAGRSDHRNQQ